MGRVYVAVSVVLLGLYFVGTWIGWKALGILLGIVGAGAAALLWLDIRRSTRVEQARNVEAEERDRAMRRREEAARAVGALLPGEIYFGDVPVEFLAGQRPGFFGVSEKACILTTAIESPNPQIERIESLRLLHMPTTRYRGHKTKVDIYQWPDQASFDLARMTRDPQVAIGTAEWITGFAVDLLPLRSYHDLMRQQMRANERTANEDGTTTPRGGDLQESIDRLSSDINALEQYYAWRYTTMDEMLTSTVDALAKLHAAHDMSKLATQSGDPASAGMADRWHRDAKKALADIPTVDRVAADVSES